MCEFRCPHSPEGGIGFPEAGVTGSCKPPNEGAGRAANALNCCTIFQLRPPNNDLCSAKEDFLGGYVLSSVSGSTTQGS